MAASNRTQRQLLAELVAEAVRPHSGAVGVVVRDVLSPDPKVLLERLSAMHEEEGFPELRIAYLTTEVGDATKQVGIGEDVLSTEIEQAERWRNEPDLEALIVVVARGDEAKLSSLADFGTVTSRHLKDVLVERAMGGPVGQKDGEVSGPAVSQMLATRRLLRAILAQEREGELITTPARREVLREHFYRELTKGAYPPEERRLWADRLRLLLDGEIGVEVCCQLIDVRLGVDTSSLGDRRVLAKDGEESVPIRVRELNEELIEPRIGPLSPCEEDGHGGKPAEEVSRPPGAGSTGNQGSSPADAESRGLIARQRSEEAGMSTPVGEPRVRVPKVPEEPEAGSQGGRPRALLGAAPGPYGKQREVWFDPNLPGRELPNPHIAITGETGSGKTQATKTIVSELRGQDLPALILDFKDDYSSEAFTSVEGFDLHDASFGSLPLNPMIPAIDKQRNLINPSQHTYQVADIIKRVFKLGDQQAYRLREAIKRAYELGGFLLGPGPLPAEKSFPGLDVVQHELLDDKANEPLLGRLSPIFDLGLFCADTAGSNFQDLFQSSAVIRLAQLPSNEVKNSVAEFFLMALYNHLIRQQQIHMLRRVLVLDEAWRVVESPFLAPLMREGRAFGLGVVIASQFPRDLPEAIRGSTATRLFFSQGQVEQIREIQRTIVGKTSGPEAEHVSSVVRGLTPLSCVMHSTQYNPFVRVTTRPYFRRLLPVET